MVLTLINSILITEPEPSNHFLKPQKLSGPPVHEASEYAKQIFWHICERNGNAKLWRTSPNIHIMK
jgi:hypothetical protein